jgi:hypothetical protein
LDQGNNSRLCVFRVGILSFIQNLKFGRCPSGAALPALPFRRCPSGAALPALPFRRYPSGAGPPRGPATIPLPNEVVIKKCGYILSLQKYSYFYILTICNISTALQVSLENDQTILIQVW